MKLYHLSDLHLGVESPFLGRAGHQRMVMRKLREVISRAREEDVKFVVLAGDIFDSNALSSSLVLEFLELLSEAKDVNFILLPGGGNAHREEVSGHDAYTENSLYRRLEVKSYFDRKDHLFLLTPEDPVAVFREEGMAFYGGFFDYPKTRLAEGVSYHVAVMHGAFGERPEFKEKSLKDERALAYDYLALGHYHRFKMLSNKAAYSGAFIQFEFLPYRKGASGYVEVDLSISPHPQIAYRAFEDAPRFIYFKVLSDKDLEKLKTLDFEHSYVKITGYLEDFRDDLEEIKNRYPDRIRIDEAAEIKREALIFVEALEKILEKKVPEELREEVKEVLLYGLKISSRKSDFERFLRDKYGL
ncbi:metallophosphoesterase family protein [Thermosulfurimonas dismutans]|uniref:DNA double-strand break repair protein Mre11 n=1 Tax=Thermosulfurimonas dismutans TaxID=999894 RepID=A0A179D4K0_9BACT|nr:metallophosphoesterase [Thermosulfurimonas dismutans]OAQ20649.1 DNA double-strand break repair protein Mre11 [Thermosulfurimonas dismutans]